MNCQYLESYVKQKYINHSVDREYKDSRWQLILDWSSNLLKISLLYQIRERVSVFSLSEAKFIWEIFSRFWLRPGMTIFVEEECSDDILMALLQIIDQNWFAKWVRFMIRNLVVSQVWSDFLLDLLRKHPIADRSNIYISNKHNLSESTVAEIKEIFRDKDVTIGDFFGNLLK